MALVACSAITGHERGRHQPTAVPFRGARAGWGGGARKSRGEGTEVEKVSGFQPPCQEVWASTRRTAGLKQCLQMSHSFVTLLCPSVSCQKALRVHRSLFPGIWGQRGQRAQEGCVPLCNQPRGDPETSLLGARFWKRRGGWAFASCQWRTGRQRTGLGLKGRNVGLHKTDRRTDTPPAPNYLGLF